MAQNCPMVMPTWSAVMTTGRIPIRSDDLYWRFMAVDSLANPHLTCDPFCNVPAPTLLRHTRHPLRLAAMRICCWIRASLIPSSSRSTLPPHAPRAPVHSERQRHTSDKTHAATSAPSPHLFHCHAVQPNYSWRPEAPIAPPPSPCAAYPASSESHDSDGRKL